MPFRSVDANDTELIQFLEEQENRINAKRKTAFVQTVNPDLCGSTASIHELSPTPLNDLQSSFMASERRMDQTISQQVSVLFFQVSSDIPVTRKL